MARRYYSSTAARTTLASGVDNSTTTLSVAAVSGWPSSYPYTLIIDQDTVNEEIVEVSARSGTTLTVTRGVDGTSAVAHDAGAAVNHGVSGRDFDEPNAFINGTGVVTETLLATNSVSAAKIVDGTITDSKIGASAAIAQSKIDGLTSDLASKVDYATPTNAQSGTAYTFVAADAEKLTTASNGSAVTFTIPPQSSVTWGDDTILRVVNYGAGDLTVDGGSGVTVTNTATTVAQYQAAAAIRTGSDAWTLVPFAGGGEVPAAEISSPAATGQYTDTGVTYNYYTFTASGSLTVDTAGFADILVVGGGGSGADNNNKGGGAGGMLEVSDAYLDATTHTITVGGGAAGGGSFNRRGSNSKIGTQFIGYGGGSGYGVSGFPGVIGGSGGAGDTGAVGLENQGNAAGTGGGGGAGGSGGNGAGGAGGVGKASSITGSSVTYATGGDASGSGSGTANTGNGGEGSVSAGGAGGSGIVIVRVKV